MNLFGKDIWKSFNVKSLSIILAVTVVILSASGFIVYKSLQKNITISDDGVVSQVTTTKKTVRAVLAQNNIQISNKDYVSPSPHFIAVDGSKITIKRAIPITMIVGGKKQEVYTNKRKVSDLLKEYNVTLGPLDKINLDPAQELIRNLVLKVTRVKEEIITEKQQVAYKTTERRTSSISRGASRVVKEGRNGISDKTYKVVYEDGKVVSKELIEEKVSLKPENKVVEVGAAPAVVTVSRGEDLRAKDVIVMQASAYTAGYESTGKRPGDRGYGRTATGMIAQRGVVAVDPRVIPLGTKLYIESMDGHASYGYAIAADKGSAIKGNKIDLFYENLSDAIKFGRRSVKVYVLE